MKTLLADHEARPAGSAAVAEGPGRHPERTDERHDRRGRSPAEPFAVGAGRGGRTVNAGAAAPVEAVGRAAAPSGSVPEMLEL
jgi:hypothetical protein